MTSHLRMGRAKGEQPPRRGEGEQSPVRGKEGRAVLNGNQITLVRHKEVAMKLKILLQFSPDHSFMFV